MTYLLLTFDLEEFIAEELGIDIDNKQSFEASKRGFEKVLEILENNSIKATFFTTLEFAEFCPDLLKKAIKEKHEIALHAYSHKHRYKTMPEEKAEKYLANAKEKLEKNFKIKIKGFRAPQMSHPTYKILKNIGIEYDSSYHPTYIPKHYNLLFKTRKIHKKDNITIVPISVAALLRLPFSWIWFRNLPLVYTKICTNLCLINKNYINIYFHPWEFTNHPKLKKHFMITNKTGKKLIFKLDRYIKWCLKKGMKSLTISQYLNK